MKPYSLQVIQGLPKPTPNLVGAVVGGSILVITAGLSQPTPVWLLGGAGGFFLAKSMFEGVTKRRAH